jgi:predicted AlkP superfamily pyrophosphatase or phosphodiesterase
VQSTFVTGVLPRDHGCVANGWYFRDLAEIWFWRQADRLVGGEKLWETAAARNPDFTCAKLFWWFNMYGTATWSVTPRPIYPADGRKIPDIYTQPAELREELTARLGPFPLFRFWGPGADLVSSRWIAACAAHLYRTRRPTLTLVYVPHLDYNLQRLGPDPAALKPDLEAVDAICGELIEEVRSGGGRIVVLSEYGVMPVSDGWRSERNSVWRSSMPAHPRPLPLRTIRSRTSTSSGPHWCRRSSAFCRTFKGSMRCWTKARSAPTVSTMRARAS